MTPASAATTVVSGFTAPSPFFLNDVRPGGSAVIGTTYGAPTGYGKGAVELRTAESGSKVQVKSIQQAGMPLSALATGVSYHTFRAGASTANPIQVPALNIEADLNGAADGGYTTLVYEPYYTHGAEAIKTDTWQKWDAAAGKWWSTRAVAPFTKIMGEETLPWSQIAATPNAVVISVGLNQGSGNGGLSAAADGLIVGGLTVNFEPFVATKEDCKGGGWASSKFPAGKFKNQGDCVSSFAGS